MPTEKDLRAEIVRIGRMMHAQELVDAFDEFLHDQELPFTYDELHRALLVTSKYPDAARASADEYMAIAAELRVNHATKPRAPDGTYLPLEVLAALSLESPDAAERVERIRGLRLPPDPNSSYRIEEEAFWKEVVAKVRDWRDRKPR